MNQRLVKWILIALLLITAIWIDVPGNLGFNPFGRSMDTILGLDLRGGTQVLLEVPADVKVDAQQLEDARRIMESRTNGLGVSEVVFQIAGDRRIMGEIPGVSDPSTIVATIKETGELEFVDLGDTRLNEGTVIKTDRPGTAVKPATTATPQATNTPGLPSTGAPNPAATPETPVAEKVWHTVMTGTALESVSVKRNPTNSQYEISFVLKAEWAQTFATYTRDNVGKTLAIVLDKKIISAPSINNAITEGQGVISGSFTLESANALAIQLRYGALPIPLKVVESRIIGPTLGQDSLNKSILAGLVGFLIVTLFMLIFYRIPGVVAIVSIISYALITLAVFKSIAVTLTLPGIAGFLLSTGGALDANILMFERLKEELRSGRTLAQGVELSWKRAWPSIRDSNIATLITSLILFFFGNAFGATIVKGFAVTLFLGVAVSLLCAFLYTRTLLGFASEKFKNNPNYAKWFGL